MLVFAIVELITLVSILYAAISVSKDKGAFAGTLSGAVTLVLLYLMPKFALGPVISQACDKCEPIGKFCIGITALIGVVLVERVLVATLTYRDEDEVAKKE